MCGGCCAAGVAFFIRQKSARCFFYRFGNEPSSPRVSPPLFGRIRKDVAEKDANCEYENRDGGVQPSGFVLYENDLLSLSLSSETFVISFFFSLSFFFASLNIRRSYDELTILEAAEIS